MSEDPIEAIKQIVECIDEGCVPGSGHVTSGWLRRASKDEILDWVWGNLRGRVINALERTRDAISTLNSGSAAAMREALEFVAHMDDNGYTSFDVYNAIEKAKAALAAPARN